MQPLYWIEYNYYNACSICESNHYAEIFKECIDEIVKNKNNYINKPTYTGWSYNPELYNINKNNIGIKLYIFFTTVNSENGYILRKKSNKACIYISNKLSDIDIQSSIQHELIHIIKLYEPRILNGLNTLKETLYDEIKNYISEFNITFNYIKDVVKKKEMQDAFHHILKTTLYMFTENEQLATINAACKQIDVMDKNTVHAVLVTCMKKEKEKYDTDIYFDGVGFTGFNRNSQVINITEYINRIHLLPSLKKICNVYKDLPYSLQMLIAYYLNKHKYIKPKLKYITYDIIYTVLHNSKEPTDIAPNIQTELNNVQKFMEDNTEKYMKRLYGGIAAIMERRKLFLDLNEVCELAPYDVKRLFESQPLRYEN